VTLFVINPNSSQVVTDGIDAAIAPLRDWGHPMECLTLAEGPPGIETDQHVADVIAPTHRLALSLDPRASGYVIACFSDPGVVGLRQLVDKPVLGIREAAIAQALTLGPKIGVIAIGQRSIPRHVAAFEVMGLSERLAGDRPLDLSVADLADPDKTIARMKSTAKALKDVDGADVLILGCAGMAHYRAEVEADTGLPVVDPCQAAVAMALGQITLRLTNRTKG
jgi:allantoin racemase